MALVIGLGIAAPVGSVAADPAPPTAGRVLPWVPQDARYGTRLALFSPDFVGVNRQTYRPGIDPPLDIRSTVDGSVVSQVPAVDYSGQTSLSGRTLLRTDGYVNDAKQVVATDVVTGEALWTIDVPGGESIASVGESWVLSATLEHTSRPAPARGTGAHRRGADAHRAHQRGPDGPGRLRRSPRDERRGTASTRSTWMPPPRGSSSTRAAGRAWLPARRGGSP